MNIYILCPDTQQPIGGIKIIYQQVDILNQLGYNAFVLHTIKDFRCNWFKNTTPIVYLNQVQLTSADILWVSENAVVGKFKKLDSTDRFFRKLFNRYKYKHTIIDIWDTPCRKWVFNENAYYTFDGFEGKLNQDLIDNFYKGVEAVVCVGEDNRQYLKTVFPQITIERIHLGLNEEQLFSYNKPENKDRIIAYMPRKNADHINRVLPLLYQLPAIKNGTWKLKPLDKMPYHTIAQEMHKSAIFLSFGYPEGFSMPPAEAMISGCLVVGYHGEGGQEYFPSSSKFNVPFGAVSTYAQQVAAAIDFWEIGPHVAAYTLEHSTFVSSTYNEAENKKDLERIAKLF
jgi:glycosyltransferase involved in cell wall biosynthesis